MFWNVGRNGIGGHIANVAAQYEVDLLILADNREGEVVLSQKLNRDTSRPYWAYKV
jgi:hypothetical protein